LVSDVTGEAYDLGRGPWYEWTEGYRHTYDDRVGPPERFEDVEALLAYYQEGWALSPQPAWAAIVALEIWSFMLTRPGARVVNDLTDEVSWGDPSEVDVDLRQAGARVYRQVASRYDREDLIVR